MLRLPFVPRIKPDELLYSYIMRLAAANECDTLGMFTATFLWPERARHGNFYREIPYNIRKPSIFPGQAPFSSKVVNTFKEKN